MALGAPAPIGLALWAPPPIRAAGKKLLSETSDLASERAPPDPGGWNHTEGTRLVATSHEVELVERALRGEAVTQVTR